MSSRADVEVYDNKARPGQELSVTTTVRDEEGATLFSHERTSSSVPVKGASPLHKINTTIPLKGITAGAYVLTIEARRAGVREPVSRKIPFSVR